MKPILLILALLVITQTPLQPDREQDGFVGPVKRVAVTSTSSSESTGSKCPQLTKEYDRKGRITRHSVYRGNCGSEETRKIFTYSADGGRDETTREIRSPNSPLLPPANTSSNPELDAGVQVLTNDEAGRLIEAGGFRCDGHKTSYFYDAKGRLLETRAYRDGSLIKRSLYTYSGEERVPAEIVQYNSDNMVSERSAYSEYEFNSKGDWTKRREAKDERFKQRQVLITQREIEYWPTRP